ncbi:hypothetical protein DL769_007005 [Monosporascus sp. CRB-8-3]|nr:hypothetical protein DL769_007005 [Monosporascus sp. CRB-8-3]
MGSLIPDWQPSQDLKPSIFKPLCHPLYPQIAKETDEYFLKHWDFPDEKSRKKFLAADYSRIITLLFLTDDVIDLMSLEDATTYNERLISIARGLQEPDRSIPAEWMMWDLWEEMRAHDKDDTYKIEGPCFVFMRAQIDKTRLDPGGLAGYWEFREKDIGTALVCAIMTFGMGLQMTDEEMRLAQPVVSNFAKNLLCFNDIYSYEKEIRIQEECGETGIIVSAVPMVAELAKVGPESAKRILWAMCREWETNHHRMVGDVLRKHPSKNLEAYFKGIEYQYSGNELWSHETGRYKQM